MNPARMLEPRSVFWPEALYPGDPFRNADLRDRLRFAREFPHEPVRVLDAATRRGIGGQVARFLPRLRRQPAAWPRSLRLAVADILTPRGEQRSALFARRSETWPVLAAPEAPVIPP